MSKMSSAVVILCTITFAVAMAAIILATTQRRNDINNRLSHQHDTQHQICVAVNKLYTAQRQDAQDNWHQLDRNLKILHIKRTARIVRIARQTRDEKLRRFASQPC